ncbi:hypothetical protein PHAVU_001G215500 [Phaseolus vulgaris]|uniref:Nitrogen regulatory protein P-II n=2 Tax=Phaseolus vulgaris TaxID=3885 RepID=V7D130_PHAVU|nr:hypothetical protein PHAVU_001G215500g [Phaseolus vulgaris]ESW35205.1 hypothetical protein PHAVU_001G215500g [Phaseolus vulgaris]
MAAIAGTHVFGVVSFHLREGEMPFASSSLSRKRIGDCSQRNVVLRRRGNTAILPIISAQNIPDYVPESKFYKVEAILRAWRVPQVSSGLLKMGIRGVTVSDVRGFGAQGGAKERQGGSEFSEGNFVAKVKMEVVVEKNQVEAVIDKIIEEARTGEIGDGKIFLIPVSDVIRIRTGERGERAERMTGGRNDMLSAL